MMKSLGFFSFVQICTNERRSVANALRGVPRRGGRRQARTITEIAARRERALRTGPPEGSALVQLGLDASSHRRKAQAQTSLDGPGGARDFCFSQAATLVFFTSVFSSSPLARQCLGRRRQKNAIRFAILPIVTSARIRHCRADPARPRDPRKTASPDRWLSIASAQRRSAKLPGPSSVAPQRNLWPRRFPVTC